MEGDTNTDKVELKLINRYPPSYTEASEFIAGYSRKPKKLNFDYKKLGVVQEGTDCLAACVAMCAKYWNHYYDFKFNIPEEKRFWEKFTEGFGKSRGTSINLINTRLRKKFGKQDKSANKKGSLDQFLIQEQADILQQSDTSPLRMHKIFLNLICDVIPPLHSPVQIPQIIVYNHNIMTYKKPSDNHAVLLHRIDFVEKEITVIDPQIYDSQVKPPYPLLQSYSLRAFYEAWRFSGFMVVYVYPKDLEEDFIFTNQKEYIRERFHKKLNEFKIE